MKTEVLMKRQIFDGEIKQKSQSGFFSATDLVKHGNRWRLLNGLSLFNITAWINNKATQEFVTALETHFGKVYIPARGRGGDTWVHPYLFIDLALAISPKLKIEVYKWLYDELLKYRNFSGDSYKKMCGALFVATKSPSTFTRDIMKLADLIRIECGVKDWQTASEDQLRLRDRIHENIALLSEVMPNTKEAIRLAIYKAKQG
jgi:hypothetical protein